MLHFQESTDYFAKILDVFSVKLGIELELISEQSMLLLEDRNSSQTVW